MISRMNKTTSNANPPPKSPCEPDMKYPPFAKRETKLKQVAKQATFVVRTYSQDAPTMINKINKTTINANPPPSVWPIVTPPLQGINHIQVS